MSTKIVTKLTPEQLEKVFPVKTAIRENAKTLMDNFEDAIVNHSLTNSLFSAESGSDLCSARRDLEKFIHNLIEEAI